MELRHLRYFVAVAEEQNITRAARRLNISQPPLSRQIQDLEAILGFPLLERTPKAIRLNDAGQVFLIEARAVLQRAAEAVQTVRAVAEGKLGDLHVGYSPSLTANFLPQALRSFHASDPQIRIHLHDLSTEEMLAGLREKRLDLALTVRPHTSVTGGIAFEELLRYPVCVAMSRAHPLLRSRRLTPGRVAREPLLIYSRTEYPEYLQWVQSVLQSTAHKLRIAAEYDSASSLITALEAGTSLAIVQEGFEYFSGPRLVVRPLQPPPPPLQLGIARRSQGRPPAVLAHFLQALRTAAHSASHGRVSG